MPTLKEIAERAGVSTYTISLALNGDPKSGRISSARVRQVRELARRMGYRANAAAAAMRRGRTGFIGMIRSPSLACSVHDPAFESGIDEALHERQLCLVRDIIDEPVRRGDPMAQSPRIVRENAVDGLLINYAFGTPPVVRELLDRCRIPAIWINRKRETNCVRPDDRGAAIEATRHLIAHGHRRIAFLESPAPKYFKPLEQHYSVQDRRDGYAAAMQEAGLTPLCVPLPARVGDFGYAGHLLSVISAYLTQPHRPSAVLCGFSGGGRVALLAAARLGLRVPGDLSVMTFDNEAHADEQIGVDRVLVRYRAMGRAAVHELIELMQNKDAPRTPVVIPFEFHTAGTVGPPSS